MEGIRNKKEYRIRRRSASEKEKEEEERRKVVCRERLRGKVAVKRKRELFYS